MYRGIPKRCYTWDKAVYFMDEIAADGRVYQKDCFKCRHCKRHLELFNFYSFEGLIYCKRHFDQVYKLAGAPIIAGDVRSSNQSHAKKFSSFFGGTHDKCIACTSTVYPMEKVQVDSKPYHKTCFRCAHSGCVINASNYVAHEQKIYCRHHHSQLLKAKPNFNQA